MMVLAIAPGTGPWEIVGTLVLVLLAMAALLGLIAVLFWLDRRGSR